MRSIILRACLVAVAAMLAAPVVNAQDATDDVDLLACGNSPTTAFVEYMQSRKVAPMLALATTGVQQDAPDGEEEEMAICEYIQDPPHLINPIKSPAGNRNDAFVCVSAARCRGADTSFVPIGVYCKAVPIGNGQWACPDATYCGNSTAIDAWYPTRILNMTPDVDEPDR